LILKDHFAELIPTPYLKNCIGLVAGEAFETGLVAGEAFETEPAVETRQIFNRESGEVFSRSRMWLEDQT
jgi:hypothetical protein